MTMLLFAALALASDPQATAPAKPVGAKPKMVCVENTPLGSHIPGPRICHTRAEWDAMRHDDQSEVERVQRLNLIHG